MDVGVITTHIAPAKGYGGVSVTAAILTKAWAESGRKVVLISSDESLGGRLKPEQIRLGDSVEIELYRCYGFRRWGFGLGAVLMILRLCLNAPLIYIHGIATWPTTLAALFCAILGRPFMVAVHGGMMPAHVDLIKTRKPHKWLFYRCLTIPTLRRAIAVHCTSETEVEGVRNLLGKDARILLVPNGIDCRDTKAAPYPETNGLNLCFLGHIQQEKGINAFIKIWLETRRLDDRLTIAGRSVDEVYFKAFEKLSSEGGGAIRYLGYLERDGVNQLLASSHYLVLPSGLEATGGMRENFGNVVAEALAIGRPVLVAEGLAWNHLETVKAGFVFERNESGVRETLLKIQTLDRRTWQEMSFKARQYVESQLDSVKLGEAVWQALEKSDHFDLQKDVTQGTP